MAMQPDFRARMLADPAITAAVGRRIDWDEEPQGNPRPAITLQQASDPRPAMMKGHQRLRETRVQIDLWGSSRAELVPIVEAVVARVTQAGIVGGTRFRRSFIDASVDSSSRADGATNTTFRTRLDVLVWHSPVQ